MDAKVPLLIAENVDQVLEKMPTGKKHPTTGTATWDSPYNLLKRRLESQGYIVNSRKLDGGQLGGDTRRSRVIVQAMIPLSLIHI